MTKFKISAKFYQVDWVTTIMIEIHISAVYISTFLHDIKPPWFSFKTFELMSKIPQAGIVALQPTSWYLKWNLKPYAALKMTQFLGRPPQYDRQFRNFSRRMSEVDLDFSWNQPGRLKYRSWSIYQNLSGELGIAVADIKLKCSLTIKSTLLF